MRSVNWSVLERVAVLLLMALALVPRVRDLGASFDREFSGYQGAFFAIAAVNYERLGVGAFNGYPVLNIDLPGGDLRSAQERPEDCLTYINHPPTAALIAWSAAKLMGPSGWSQTWTEARAAPGLEPAIRLPFLLLHLAGLLMLWWLARTAFGPQVALIALALTCFLPVSALYGTLVNYENPSLVFALAGVVFYARFTRRAARKDLAAMGAMFFLGSCVTFAPAFFLPPLCLRSLWRRRLREALSVGFVGSLCALTPLLIHNAFARHALEAIGRTPTSILDRARVLLAPLVSGEVPISSWILAQLEHSGFAFGWLMVGVAAVGLALSLARGVSTPLSAKLHALEFPANTDEDIDLATPLFAGALLYLFGFYKHTSEQQWPFLLYLAPAVVLFAARALHLLSGPLWKLRAGFAPLAVLSLSTALPGIARFEEWRHAARAPGPQDDPVHVNGPQAPLPASAGAAIAELLPPGSVGVHPPALGLNLATAWYAWRSLAPGKNTSSTNVELMLEAVGLEAAPRYLILPDDPPNSATSGVEALREQLSEPTLRAAGWSGWR